MKGINRPPASLAKPKGDSMNICIPVEVDQGLESRVCAHFGSAPAFMIVDTESNSCRVVNNDNAHHGHGMCAPLGLLAGQNIDSMVVGGIGRGAMRKLEAAQIEVYLAQQATVSAVLDAFKAGQLKRMDPSMSCSGHGHSHGHGHGHGHGHRHRHRHD
jgi:predicted Fe-Mo cluster-binding NifX family protein